MRKFKLIIYINLKCLDKNIFLFILFLIYYKLIKQRQKELVFQPWRSEETYISED
jgi:hypothetical protein